MGNLTDTKFIATKVIPGKVICFWKDNLPNKLKKLYSHICVLPDKFIFKSTLITTDFKKVHWAEQEDTGIPSATINALVLAPSNHLRHKG